MWEELQYNLRGQKKEERPKIVVPPPFEFEPPNILRREGKIVRDVWRDGKKPTQEEVNEFIRSFPQHSSGKEL